MSRSVKHLCLYAMGVALFVVLALCVRAPVFENYYLCLGYVVMAVYCYSFGAGAGAAVGCVGVLLYCILTNGLRGMPGWALGNVVIGVALGLTFRLTRQMKPGLFRWVIHILAVVAATAAGVLAVKSAVEFVLYGQPFWFRIGKNVYAFVADVVLLLVSLPVCEKLDGYLHRYVLKKNCGKAEGA
ncbi:MAG: ECF transporter S component [Clostridia bacterium]|nr:ECF transporter S component [Clostridia bacterium]